MQTPLNATASTAGALLSGSSFEIPQYQREYSWQDDEVADFWNDLRANIESESYFLGLVILTDEEDRKHVVDGQQRLVTLTLLACALFYQAKKGGRNALADRIQSDFLKAIDYKTDIMTPRVKLSDPVDDETLRTILESGTAPKQLKDDDSVSARIASSFEFLQKSLEDDLKVDPFARLGKWTEFLTHKVYFAVFVHPDAASAYQVFEVINTRGRELTTADLLKNYVLSQTAPKDREARYEEWRSMARRFPPEGASNTFVQYIRHVVTVKAGHILPRDLFGFLAQRNPHPGKTPPSPHQLVEDMKSNLPLYLQMIDQTLPGPSDPEALKVFSALNALGVITVRPILLALNEVEDPVAGMQYILRLVVRRMVVGNLGTGNVERRLAEAARRVHETKNWEVLKRDLADLNPTKDDFVETLARRSYSKTTMAFLRRSILERTLTPESEGVLHLIYPRGAQDWEEMGTEEASFWTSTIGNSFLSELRRRPREASQDFEGFKVTMLPEAAENEWVDRIADCEVWNAESIEEIGQELAEAAGEIWY